MRIRRGMLRREGSKLGRTEEGKMIMQGCLLVVVGMAIGRAFDVVVVREGVEYESKWVILDRFACWCRGWEICNRSIYM